jgi:hypothetical protein
MFLDHLAKSQNYRAKRVSSYDRTGGNDDYRPIKKGETLSLAEIKGPGQISHIWFTISCADKNYLRRLIFRAYWDGAKTPAIETPVGDFFGIGHGHAASYQSAFFSTSAPLPGHGGGMAMNCWIPMPFAKSAKLEIVNESDEDVRAFYYYIDYRELPAVPDDLVYFHAQWRRELPTDGWTGKGSVWHSPEWRERMDTTPDGKNLTGKGNYLILDTEGRGHFVGCNVSIKNLYEGWWGEGDDMFFVDGQSFPPDLHGTGTEDYFCHAWGMQCQNAHLYHGVSLAVSPVENVKAGGPTNWRGKYTNYRLHVVDPVPFTKSLVMSIEHGHANDRSDDWASVAYWYLDRPEHKQYAPLPAREARDPI